MKNVAIFGATGSIGSQTLEVIRHCNKNQDLPNFNVVSVIAYNEKEELEKLANEFSCHQALFTEVGRSGLIEIAKRGDVDIIVMAVVGVESIYPTIEALNLGKRVLLATKEALVVAGGEVMEASKNGELISVDSEHNAIFQALKNEDISNVRQVLLTCSGGPFLGLSLKELETKHIKDAMSHPVWGMGMMNTVNSATLMNKAFEAIELHYLFNVPYDKIEIVVHKEVLNHGTVEFVDGFSLAVFAPPTMLKPIAYALAYPKRIEFPEDNITFNEETHYQEPDYDTFILARIGVKAGKIGGTAPLAIHAINEVVVYAASEMLDEKFLWIQETVAEIYLNYEVKHGLTLEENLKEHNNVIKMAKSYVAKKLKKEL